MLCCLIDAIVLGATWLVPILIVPALSILAVIVIYAIATAKHPPKVEVYESEKTFRDPSNPGMSA